MEEQKQTQLEIDLSHEVAQGTYANLTIIAHSTSEFIIDFIRLIYHFMVEDSSFH